MGKKIPYRRRPASPKMLAHLSKVRVRLPEGVAAFNALFNQYKWVAKDRDLDWALTKEEFKELTQQNCFYCDSKPSNKKSSQDKTGSFVYNGIDRVNNACG